MVQGHPNTPEIHSHTKCLLLGFAQHCTLIHVRVQVFLCTIDRNKLLIIVQLAGSPEVRQLIDALPLLAHQAHDVPRFDVPMDNAILPQVVHASHHTAQHH